jgi:uncharacterized membrane protein
MESQNYKNHGRVVTGFHIVTFALILILLTLSIINLVKVYGEPSWFYAGVMPILTTIIITLVAWYSRVFPLKAQDRAIRAEENLRYYVLTGKLLDAKLHMSQIIALRFAPDEEFPKLAAKAVAENLKNKEVKQAITNWKADNHRA